MGVSGSGAIGNAELLEIDPDSSAKWFGFLALGVSCSDNPLEPPHLRPDCPVGGGRPHQSHVGPAIAPGHADDPVSLPTSDSTRTENRNANALPVFDARARRRICPAGRRGRGAHAPSPCGQASHDEEDDEEAFAAPSSREKKHTSRHHAKTKHAFLRKGVHRKSRAAHSVSLAGVTPVLAAKTRQIVASCGSTVISAVSRRGNRSNHPIGRAVDLRGNPGCIYAQLKSWPGGYSTDYAAARHVHISYNPGGQEWGLRFAHGGSRKTRVARYARAGRSSLRHAAGDRRPRGRGSNNSPASPRAPATRAPARLAASCCRCHSRPRSTACIER